MAFCSRGVCAYSKDEPLSGNAQPLRSRQKVLLRDRYFAVFFLFFLWSCAALAKSDKPQSSPKPLVVYIHETLYVTQKETLEKQGDFSVILKPFSGSDLVGKILLEGSTLKADVVVGIEGERASDPRIASLAAPLPAALFQRLFLPFSWKDKRFLPISYAYLAFLYDGRTLAPSTETLESFLKSLPPKSLVVPDPRTSMVGRGALSWVKASEYGILHQKVLTYPKGWSGTFSLFNRGRAKVMLGYTTSVLYHQGKGQSFVRWAALKKTAHPVQVMTAFITAKKEVHPKAVLFLETLLSPSLQRMVIQNYGYPVIEISLPESHHHCRPKNAFLLEGGEGEKDENLKNWMASGYQK